MSSSFKKIIVLISFLAFLALPKKAESYVGPALPYFYTTSLPVSYYFNPVFLNLYLSSPVSTSMDYGWFYPYLYSGLLITQDITVDRSLIKREDFFSTDTTDTQPPLFRKKEVYRGGTDGYSFGNKPDPKGYRVALQMDSTISKYRRKEQVDSLDMNPEIEIPLDSYLKQRKNNIQREVWDSLLTRYDMKKALAGGDLARLLSQATGMTIPIPPNPVIGLFGKPEISINVNGEVNIRVGWRWDSQNLGTVSAFAQTQSSPVFSQDIRVNVSGRIGDKLKLSTDWNTRRTFEHDNKFKIGSETLPTSTSFIISSS